MEKIYISEKQSFSRNVLTVLSKLSRGKLIKATFIVIIFSQIRQGLYMYIYLELNVTLAMSTSALYMASV